MPDTTAGHANSNLQTRGDRVAKKRIRGCSPHVAKAGAPPNFITVPRRISMWGNDVHGDCVTAEEAFAKAFNDPEVFLSDNEVITWATSHGVLEGANLVEVLQWMQSGGSIKAGLPMRMARISR